MNGAEMPPTVKTNETIFKVLGYLLIGFFYWFLPFFFYHKIPFFLPHKIEISSTLSWVIMIASIVLGTAYLIVAKGIAKRKSWAKIMEIILIILSFPLSPIGTGLALWTLSNCCNDEHEAWFKKDVQPSA